MTSILVRPTFPHRRTTVDDLINHKPANNITSRVRRSHHHSQSIGTGSYGDIYLGTMDYGMPTERRVVIKILRGVHTNPDEFEKTMIHLNREVAVWRPLEHPYIAKFLGLTSNFGPSPGLVSPFLEGKLMRYIEEHPEERRRLAQEIASGMQYLHHNTVIHGDLKTDNVLVSSRGNAQIIDFGIAQIMNVKGFTTKVERHARYTAPELMPIHEFDESSSAFGTRPTVESDTFSFGILLLQICHGRNRNYRDLPYNHLPHVGHDFHVIRSVNMGDRPRKRHYNPGISQGEWDLISQCWHQTPDKRPTMGMVLRTLSR